MTSSISPLFQAGFFRKYDFVVSQLNHLTPKTTNLGVSKMWSTIFSPSKLTDMNSFVQLRVVLKQIVFPVA